MAFVQLSNRTQVGLRLSPRPVAGLRWTHLRSKMGIQIEQDPEAAGEVPHALVLSGKEEGKLVTEIAPNQRACMTLGTVNPTKFQALLVPNPELGMLASVETALVIEPKDTQVIRLIITAHKAVRLADLAWYMRVYLLS